MKYSLFYLLPKNLISWIFGKLAALELPEALNSLVIQWFANAYKVDLSEAASPLGSYPSLAAFFVRDLKADLRPVCSDLICPVDGVLTQLGQINCDELIQAKGIRYTVFDLLQSASAEQFVDGHYAVFYLAPHNYHHVHSPCALKTERILHVPGTLWPVNPWSVENVGGLFCVNERVSVIGSGPKGKVAVVLVGATNVGNMSLEFADVKTNGLLASKKRTELKSESLLGAGERLGTFHLGSTVILLLEKGSISNFRAAGPVKWGEPLEA